MDCKNVYLYEDTYGNIYVTSDKMGEESKFRHEVVTERKFDSIEELQSEIELKDDYVSEVCLT